MKKRKRRRLSAGSLVMLTLTGAVLILSLLLVIRLHGGKLPTVSTPVTQALVGSENGAGTEAETPPEQSTEGSGEAQPRLTEMPRNTAPPAETDQAVLTVAGTLAIEKSLRQSCYAADTKVYDFTELLALLRNEVQGDLNAVFLENLLMEDTKVSELVLPWAPADLLRETGFQVCLSGFSKAWDKKA